MAHRVETEHFTENPTLTGQEAVNYLAALVFTYEEGKPDMSTWGKGHPKIRDFYLLEHVMLLTNLATANMIYNRDRGEQNDSIDITATGFPRYSSLRDHAIQALSLYKKENGKPIPAISEAVEKIDEGWKNALIRRLLGNPAGEKQEWGDQITVSEKLVPGLLMLSLPPSLAVHTACGVKYFPHAGFLLFWQHVPYSDSEINPKHMTADSAITQKSKGLDGSSGVGSTETIASLLRVYIDTHGDARKILDHVLIAYHPFVYRDHTPELLTILHQASRVAKEVGSLLDQSKVDKISSEEFFVMQTKAAEVAQAVGSLPNELAEMVTKATQRALAHEADWYLWGFGGYPTSGNERRQKIRAIDAVKRQLFPKA